MAQYTMNLTLINNHATAKIGHRNTFPDQVCNRPGMIHKTAMTNSIPPKVCQIKTPIFQSINGHSREHHEKKDSTDTFPLAGTVRQQQVRDFAEPSTATWRGVRSY